MMTFDLVDVAENGWGLTPGMTVARREVMDDLILIDSQGPVFFRLALRLRLGAREVDNRIAAVRGWFGDAGRADFTWIVGTTSTPADLTDRLLAAGAVAAADDPEMAAMS